jgi:ribosomal RNA assembly protein
MEQILIAHKRAELLDKKLLDRLRERLNCKIELSENELTIDGEAYDEYNAKNVLSAFGHGFDLDKAYKLLNEDYFLQLINLKDSFRSKDQLMRVKARIIGTEGRAKEYIESVSGADIAVFGSSISIIGKIDELKVAEAAIRILIGGGTHKTAYKIMEKERTKINGEINA